VAAERQRRGLRLAHGAPEAGGVDGSSLHGLGVRGEVNTMHPPRLLLGADAAMVSEAAWGVVARRPKHRRG